MATYITEGIVATSTEAGTAIWRVTSADASAHEHAFDALVIPNDIAGPQRLERHLDASVPFEGKLADVPLTLVVQVHDDVVGVIVEYHGFAPDGTLRIMGRSNQTLTVIVRTEMGIRVAGLPKAGRVGDAQTT